MIKSQLPSTLGVTISINTRLLAAFGLGWLSVSVWPSAVEWWGLGVLSVVSGFAAVLALVQALRTMVQVRNREIAIRRYLAQGPGPQSSEMASSNDLDKAGMR